MYKHIFIILLLIAFGSAITTYEYTRSIYKHGEEYEKTLLTPASKQTLITADTKLYYRYKYSICEKNNLKCTNEILINGDARKEFINHTYNELKNKYPTSKRWNVHWDGEKLILERTFDGLCPKHNKSWHLSSDETGEKVIVYLGPSEVGTDAGVTKTTDIYLETLPVSVSKKIMEGKYQFLDWEELVATLDSLDEYNLE